MKRLPQEDRAGIYITVIVHLVVLIVLLAGGLGASISSNNSFLIDFSQQEEVEKLRREVAFREEISRRLEQLIAENGGTPIRNVAVDKGALKDDRGTDAEQLYKDAEALRRELENGASHSSEDYVETPGKAEEVKEEERKETKYSGPSVLSYELEGRKASRLPIPAYRCMGAGEVKVIIYVNTAGTVMSATIDETCSSKDGCLRDFAKRAARLSKFSASPSAPPKQQGYIIYKFIAQ